MPRTHATVAISLHPDLREEARQRAQELGFGNSFSAYVAKLIAEDIRGAEAAREPAAPYRVSSAADPAARLQAEVKALEQEMIEDSLRTLEQPAPRRPRTPKGAK